LEAGHFIETIEKRNSLKVAYPEELRELGEILKFINIMPVKI